MSNQDPYADRDVSRTNSTWPTWPRSTPIRLLTILMSMAMCFGMGLMSMAMCVGMDGFLTTSSQWALVAGIVLMFVGGLYGFLFGVSTYVDHVLFRNQRKKRITSRST